ncbi:3-isopropylmalate dehydrogenase [Acidisphaera sp. L21]|uniref:3-isopropylmalate dehydrogenase n=1 Tax=Acidisphaera sp. L21 TaxID=1641851 RepID=UPI00131E5FE3|nr:3-isopropylmalate dehydrogenase [Acidisphaera sp. L21]
MSAGSNQMNVAVIGGEGIGPEVTTQARRVLSWFIAKRSLPVDLTEAAYGLEAYRATGEVLPPESRKVIDAADAILFGATGGAETKEVPIEARKKNTLLKIRKSLDLFANVRPIVTQPGLYEAAPLKARVLEGVDFVIVRELSSGIYFGEPRGIETLPDGSRRGFNTTSYTTAEIRRVARFAFELARTRRGKLCSVDKANVMETGVLWREEVVAMHAAEFPEIELTHMHVDNAAMQVVYRPSQFDVMLTDNIFGDILSDAAAVAAGSLGMLPSASLGPVDATGRRQAIYEPVHGSAPDIAGMGIANPIGSILSVAMLLRMTLGQPEDATLLERAVSDALAGGARTADIVEPGAKPMSTSGMGDAILDALERLAH